MESDNENNGLDIDSSPGALVWVRRRNGSWWPGRVLGPKDLQESCLNLPRSGTPIKLLGRVDGSVDWYNLEKSKRIKAFRCGEYDEFIEKVKNHAMRSSRKVSNSGKYVRKEDAILHALEIEESQASDGNEKIGPGNNSLIAMDNKNIRPLSNGVGHNKEPVNASRKVSKHKVPSQKLSQSGLSFEHPEEHPASCSTRYTQKKRWRTPNDPEDDTTKGMKRMRDLHDLGIGIMLKREPNGCLRTKGFHDPTLPDTGSLGESDFDNDFSADTPINSSRDSCSSLKLKQPLAGQAYESLKKKCRRRSLAEVWMGPSKGKIQSLGHQSAISEESSLQGVTGLQVRVDNYNLKKKDSAVALADSPNCSGTSCEEALLNTHENAGNAGSGCTNFPVGAKESLFSDILEFIDNDISDRFINVPIVAGENTADLHPAFVTCPSEKLSIITEEGSDHCIHTGPPSHVNEGLGEACSTSSSTRVDDMRQKIDISASEWHTKGKRNARHLSLNKHVDSKISVDRAGQSGFCLANRNIPKEATNCTSDESLTPDSSCQQIKCMAVSEVCDATGDQIPNTSLVDAGKTNFESENGHANLVDDLNAFSSVPCALPSNGVLDCTLSTRVSLPPRQIRLPSRYRDSESSRLYDVEVTVQSNYQGQRVPLVSLRSKFNGQAILGHPVTVEIVESGRGLFNRSMKKLLSDRSKTVTKPQAKSAGHEKSCAPMSRSPWSNRKPSSGKKSGFSPRKIRRLSSFAMDHKVKEDRRKLVVEKIGGPAVSCIPLRLVFSRLNEALNSSARPAT